MSEETWTIHIDGAARGNPGPAAFAYVIQPPNGPAIEEADCLGHRTNNVAEYTALVEALARAADMGARRLLVYTDSELLVKQLAGEYKVKNDSLRELLDEARTLMRQFDFFGIRHVRREQNKRADQLCNEALDGRCGKAAIAAKPAPVERPAASDARVRADAIACLQGAAAAWKAGDNTLTPEALWEQLWSILEEGAVLRKPKKR
jgi:ribonuclease HI